MIILLLISNFINYLAFIYTYVNINIYIISIIAHILNYWQE